MDSKHIWDEAKSSEPASGFEGRVRERIVVHRHQNRIRRGLAGLAVIGILVIGVGMGIQPPPETGEPAVLVEAGSVGSKDTVGIQGEDVLTDAAEFYFAEDTYLDDMIEAALGGEASAGEEIQSYKQGRSIHERLV